MATVKKSKKKIIVPISIILVIAIVAGCIFGVTKSKSGEEVKLNTISTGDIYEKVSLTGDVTAGTSKDYKVGTVATVKSVNVKVGDQVKKGDVLATFDTTSLDSQVSSLQTSYNDALKNYNNAVKNQKTANNKASTYKKQIDAIEKKIAKLNKKIAKTTTTKKKKTTTTTTTTKASTTNRISQWLATTTTKAATTTTTTTTTTQHTTDDGSPKYTVALSAYPTSVSGTVSGSGKYRKDIGNVTIKATPSSGWLFLGWYSSRAAYLAGNSPLSNSQSWTFHLTSDVNYVAVFTEDTNATTTTAASINDISKALVEINKNIASITNDVKTLTTISGIVANSISGAIASGQLNSKTIADLVGKDIQTAITNGIVDSTKLIVESGVAVDMIKAAVSSIDYRALAKGVSDSDNAVLTGLEIQKALLSAQYEVYKTQGDQSIVTAQKSAVTAAKKALDSMKEQQTALANGWTADFDGVITKVDISPDSQTTALQAGITLENHDVLVATVSLSEYDVHKVKLGMKAKVTTAYGKYDGEVASIAPTATGGSSSSILDSVGSMAGVSGLSSLTNSGAGVECTIEIKNPDENIIAGFDADVEIQTGQYLGVTVVPIESITLEKTGSYVYLYNDEDKTVTKTEIKTGAISDTAYEVTSGLKPGDRIVASPKTDYKEDTFKVKVVDSTNK